MGKVQIVSDGITHLKTEAVVNAANDGLWAGGGVCGVIFRSCDGAALEKECRAIGHCDTGSAVITNACGFPDAKYIIHAVGPVWNGGNNKEPQKLYGCYMASLELAKEYKVKSIGFPLISSGIFGYPLDGAWRKALQACQDFLNQNPDIDLTIKFGIPDPTFLQVGKETAEDLNLELA